MLHRMTRCCVAVPTLVLVVSLLGCGSIGHGASSGQISDAITVQITNVFPNDAIQAGTAQVTLIAVVYNDVHGEGVTWSLTTANTSCSPACGTLVPSASSNLSAVYTPPTKGALNQQATITATSVADPTQEYSFIFTIIPPLSVSITNKFASVLAGTPAVIVNAAVANDATNSGVTWSLAAGGSNCSPDCGTLVASAAPSFAALYTPPTSAPGGASANPTITATSVAKTSASDNFSFTIASPASLLKGNYVFLLRGYDTFSGPMAMAGVISADGKGNITTGEVDINNGGGITFASAPQTGTYTVDLSFNQIPKVTLEISSFHFGDSSIDLKFRVALSADGKRGHIIEFDGSSFINSGDFLLQDSSAVSAAPSGNFAFDLDSDAPFGGRTVAAGQLVFGASGITGGVIDQSKAGNPAPTFSSQSLSPSAVGAPDSNGRGTLSITVNGLTNNYAYYIVDAGHIRLIEIDSGVNFGTVQAGTAVHQAALTADSINATSVIQLTGMDEASGTNTPGPDVIIGVMTISGGNAFTLTFDYNDLGVVSSQHHPAPGSIASFDPSTGRAVISYPGGFQTGFMDSAVIYLYDQGSGFIIDTDISTPDGTPPDQAITNNAFSGTLTEQAGAPFQAAAISGNLIAGFGASASPDIPNWDLALVFSNTSIPPSYSAFGELASVPSEDSLASNAQFKGTFTLLNASLGYGQLKIPAAVFGDFTSGTTVTASFYLIAPNQFVLIGVTPGEDSGVAFFDPQ